MLCADSPDERWQLYRLLGEPARLRLLALAAAEELSVGELAEVLGESQPNVSRHTAPLRRAGLLTTRREGTRLFVRISPDAAGDPVVADAVQSGRRLCDDEGSLARIAQVVRARDGRTREFFAQVQSTAPSGIALQVPTYLAALGALLPGRELAVDAGTGDGSLLDFLSPLYRRVVAIDRSRAQLDRAEERLRARDQNNVVLVHDEVDGANSARAVGEGADLVASARMLHHAPLPRATVAALAALVRPGGHVLIIDYERHEDERLRDLQADVWMGFGPEELLAFAAAADLVEACVFPLPSHQSSGAHDAHLGWQALVARRAP